MVLTSGHSLLQVREVQGPRAAHLKQLAEAVSICKWVPFLHSAPMSPTHLPWIAALHASCIAALHHCCLQYTTRDTCLFDVQGSHVTNHPRSSLKNLSCCLLLAGCFSNSQQPLFHVNIAASCWGVLAEPCTLKCLFTTKFCMNRLKCDSDSRMGRTLSSLSAYAVAREVHVM